MVAGREAGKGRLAESSQEVSLGSGLTSESLQGGQAVEAGDLLQAVLGQRVHRQQVRSYSNGRLGVVLLRVRLVVRGVLVDHIVVLVVSQVGPAVTRAVGLRLRDSTPGGLRRVKC